MEMTFDTYKFITIIAVIYNVVVYLIYGVTIGIGISHGTKNHSKDKLNIAMFIGVVMMMVLIMGTLKE